MSLVDRALKLSARNLRLLGIALVVALTVLAFASGVHTTNIPDMQQESIFAWFYFAGGLFVFGGLDLGTPAGGPVLLRSALWFAYFLAPAITTSAIAEALLVIVRPELMARKRLKQHVILAGSGKVAQAYAAAIRAVEPERMILHLEHAADQPPVFDGGKVRPSLFKLQGDARNLDTLQAAALDQAFRVIFLTDDDLVNLEGAWTAQAAQPGKPIAAHVKDLALLRPVNRLSREQRHKAGNRKPPMVFSTHRIGSLYLYEEHLHPLFESTGYRDVVVIAGFGHFSQTILELLCAMATEDLEHIVVVDPAATRKLRQLRSDVDTGPVKISAIDGDLDDPGTWLKTQDVLSSETALPVFLLTSADQTANYKAAMLLRAQAAEPRIFIRCFHRSTFAESLASELNTDILAFEDVLTDALHDHYEALTSMQAT